jgi:penicillin-binding protein 2
MSVGGINVGQWQFPDWKAGGHGWTTVTKALAESVNTFFYIIGGGYNDFQGLGVEKIKQYAERFGLGQKLGVDVPGERAGFIPTSVWKQEVKNEQWYIGDTYHVSIGQGDLLVTPLQVAAWTSVIANGGTLYQPHVLRGWLTADGTPVYTERSIIVDSVVSPDTTRIVRQGLRQGVVSGSSRGLSVLPFAVAAKTGTAQWSSKELPHAWATAFGPYETPELVVTVLIEQGGEGSSVAIPVVRDIFQWWGSHVNTTEPLAING